MTRLLHHGGSVAIGRIALSALRMAAALIVARLAGVQDFGAYALMLTLIGIAEWLVDFGQTDMAVRDMARRPRRRTIMIAALVRIKMVQGPVVALALPLMLMATGQAPDMIWAGCTAGIAIIATAWMQPARAALRLALRMNRDVGAELAGVMLMLPLLALACLLSAPLWVMIGTFAIGRMAQAMLMACWVGPVGKRSRRPHAPLYLARQAVPLGCAGLMVLLYDALAPVLLASLMDMHAVALYAAAARFTVPVLIAVQAMASAAFPMMARDWRHDPDAFARTQQGIVNLSAAWAATAFAGLHGGAEFVMGLMGPDFVTGAPLLQLMAWTMLARAITMAMAPLIMIAGWQGRAMMLTLTSLAVQCAALILLVPGMGVMGAAWACLLVELLLGTVAVSHVAQRSTDLMLDWRPVILMVGGAIASIVLIAQSPVAGSFAGGAIAASIILAAILLFHGKRPWLTKAGIA
ncbi:lipopolysaccharide biosynthesis protein [Sphingobium sp.]|uniref:lipopolysaccharide biosynthesis protein n=1 Tax=Sphingobium sp. TaxID=1912891 RepID=UPI003B3B0A5D